MPPCGRLSTCRAGFGLGFERLVLFVTGMTNIRDVIPCPRFPKARNFRQLVITD